MQRARWTIDRAFHDYQTAAEERRQLAADIGEVIRRFVDVLVGVGWSEEQARAANVHELAGAITGMKPPQYAVWAFQQLGARAGDELVDLYPGSGAVSEAWRRYTAASTDDTSRAGARADDDTSRTPAIEVLSDVSPGPTTVVPAPGHRAEPAATLTLFDAGTTGDPSSEASESAA